MKFHSTHKRNRNRKKRNVKIISLRKLGVMVLIATTTLVVMLQVATWLNAQEMFLVKKVKIEGNRFVSADALRELVKVDSARNLFDYDLVRIADAVKTHPLIAEASVSRGLPSRLIVQVTEKEPLALLRRPELIPIDQLGNELSAFKPKMLYDYPIISDQTELQRVIQFLKHIKANHFTLYSQISEIAYSNELGIYFYLCEGTVPVVAGKDQPEQNSAKLLSVLPRIASEGTLSEVQYFDLRFDHRVIVKTT